MRVFSVIIVVVTGLAGLYYLVNSRGTSQLREVEHLDNNLRRVRLRRIGGGVMVALAGCFALLLWLPADGAAFAAMLLVVVGLVGAILVLAMADLRLTRRMRDGGAE